MTTLDTQVGGDHYRRFKIQPVEYIIANGIGYLPGNIIKYATRYAHKGGAEDIRKIIQYCELILEFEYGEKVEEAPSVEILTTANLKYMAFCRTCGKVCFLDQPPSDPFFCSYACT